MCKCIGCNSRKSCDLYKDRKHYGLLTAEEIADEKRSKEKK